MDDELKQELMDSFTDIYEDVEICLADIRDSNDPELLNRLFRSIHNAKGNAGMMQLEKIVAFTHAIEEVAGAIRAKRFPCSPAVSEVIQISMDRLRDIHQRDIFGKPTDNVQEKETIQQLEALATCDSKQIEASAAKLLTFFGAPDTTPSEAPIGDTHETEMAVIQLNDSKLQSDLTLFQEMALQIDSQSQYWEGRSIQIFDWAMKINHIGEKPVGYEQFAAAIYMHDIGMTLLPTEVINKQGELNDDDWRMIHQHPRWGYELLKRIPGWDEAAQITLDHHERIDGTGYPNSKSGSDIHTGAKIIAIVDAFFSITRTKADRGHRKTVMHAISEINNGAGTQFDGVWVQHFNEMIRQELQSGML